MQLQQVDATLRDLEIRVAVVTFEAPEVAERFRAETETPWPILVDSTREAYHAYGMRRAKLRHLLGPTTLRAYARELYRGERLRLPTGDTTQQGGDVLVDPDGMLRFHHIGAGSGYRRPVDEILAPRRAWLGRK